MSNATREPRGINMGRSIAKIRKNERLIGIRPYRTSSDEWHLELTYVYEDEKGEHNVIFPDVQCPFPTQAVPFPDAIPYDVGVYIRSCGYSIPGLEQIPLDIGYCRLAQERGVTDQAYAFDIITKYFTREMTIEEIEKKLGYKVKIVAKENEK